MLNKSITSLAILKVNWDQRHIDYIENFLPFFSNLIRIKHYEKIDIDTIKKDFKNEYGLLIPSHPIMAILGRLRSKGLITKTAAGFIPNYDKIEDGNFDKISAEQGRKLNKLVISVIEFAKKYNITLTEEIAEKALLGFFKENELSILYATEEKDITPDVEVSKSTRFLTANFIYSAKKSEPEIFSFILDIAVGSALAATILYGHNLAEHFAGRMKNLNLYLDTGYLFSLLGVDGGKDKESFEELTKDLVSDGAKLKIFEHTYDEMMSIFSSALYWMNQKNYDMAKASRTLKYFITHEFTETDVEMFIAKIPQILEKFKIEKTEKPKYSEDVKYQIGELELKELIVAAYKSDPFFNETQKDETIGRDIESIYSICKLRKGKIAFTLHDASHIFVTRNKLLAKISGRVQSVGSAPFSIPPCTTDIFIGTLLWLQNPKIANALNEKRIIADAYAAIQPDPHLIKKYLDQIETLKKANDISDKDYYILKTDRVAFNLLSEATVNDVSNFGPKTTTEILDEINRKHISALKTELEQEKVSHKKTTNSLQEKEQAIQDKSYKVDTLTGEKEKLLNFVVNTLTWVVLPAIVALIICALIITTFPAILPNLFIQIIAFIFLVVLALIGTNNIKSIKSWLRDNIRKIIIERILKI